MITVKRVKSNTEKEDALNIRESVFVKEQNVPIELEMDEFDEIAQHFVAYLDGELAGTGRIYKDSNQKDSARLGRVAVLPHMRRKGVARAIIKELLEWALEEKICRVILHSQVTSIGLYKEFGFEVQGEDFEEAGISHTEMIINLLSVGLESDGSIDEPDFAGGVW